jgi:hypothetical protein
MKWRGSILSHGGLAIFMGFKVAGSAGIGRGTDG